MSVISLDLELQYGMELHSIVRRVRMKLSYVIASLTLSLEHLEVVMTEH